MDNTIGKHVALSQLIDGGSEPSRFIDRTLPYDRVLEPLRQSDPVDATSIFFRWWPADFTGVFNCVAGKQIVLVSEGAVSIKSGDGENRTFGPGAVLKLSQHDRQDYQIQAADGQPFRAAVIDLDGANCVQTEAVLPHQS